MSGLPARSHLHRLLASGQFVVTAELQATDSPDPESVYRLADLLRGSVDAVNCTDNSAAHPHLSPVAAARLLLDRGVEPIVQFACRDRNRLALQADLVGAVALGARNVCLMTGDDVTAGDHPEAKPIYDIDAVHAIQIARIMRDRGIYVSGRRLDRPLPLFIGAVENPFAPPHDFRPMRLGKKVEAGAEFVQTQIVFNLATMRVFMARSGELGLLDRVFILPSVYVCRSAGAPVPARHGSGHRRPGLGHRPDRGRPLRAPGGRGHPDRALDRGRAPGDAGRGGRPPHLDQGGRIDRPPGGGGRAAAPPRGIFRERRSARRRIASSLPETEPRSS